MIILLRKVARFLMIGIPFIFGCYLLLSMRTMAWGVNIVATVFLAFVWVLPLGLIAFLGYDWKRMLRGGMMFFLGAILLCEGTATLEEQLFQSRISRISGMEDTVFKKRWWPFEHHYVYFDPSTETFGGGD